MKIVVYGATGMAGREITKGAVARGHEVVAVSRGGVALEGATAEAADIVDIERFTALTASADAVVVAIPIDRKTGNTGGIIDAHRQIIAARPATRVVVVGGAGSLTVGGVVLSDAPGFPDEYKVEAEAFTVILNDYLASSGLDWTYVSPSPIFAPGERTGYVLGTDSPVGNSVTSTDFADAILDEIETPAYKGRRFTVASKS